MRTLESRREMFIGSIYNKLRDTDGDSKKPVRVFDRAATDPLKDPRASLSTCSLKAIRATKLLAQLFQCPISSISGQTKNNLIKARKTFITIIENYKFSFVVTKEKFTRKINNYSRCEYIYIYLILRRTSIARCLNNLLDLRIIVQSSGSQPADCNT